MMNLTLTVPAGTLYHGNPNLLCTPPSWSDYILFFFGNYVAHAATVVSYPGDSMTRTIAIVSWRFISALFGSHSSCPVYCPPRRDFKKESTSLCSQSWCALSLFPSSSSGSGIIVGDLVSSIMHHLSFIAPDSALFKATSWPTFLAGAESGDFEQRTWVVSRLNALWEKLRWGYIRSALDLLKLIWDKKDRGMNNLQHPSSWVQEVKKLNTDLLIV